MQVLKHAEDFKRALAQPWLAKTPHFALHHLSEGPAVRRRAAAQLGLSSGSEPPTTQPVDKFLDNPVDKPVDSTKPAPEAQLWVGYVVPKRHARRAVTRNLLKRQMRQVLHEQQRTPQGLPGGLWVLRLRQGFDRERFPSAASAALRQASWQELHQLMGLALGRLERLRPGGPAGKTA